jgi:hypothetical protein
MGYTAQPVRYTWWGGALGPKLFTHVKCGQCGEQYNGKTGGSNSRNIAIYLVVSSVIGLILGIMLYGMRLFG